MTLVSDTLLEKNFLACRDADIKETPDSYVSIFTLYRRMEVQDDPEPEEPEELEEPEEPGEVVETSPSMTVLPEGWHNPLPGRKYPDLRGRKRRHLLRSLRRRGELPARCAVCRVNLL